MKYLVLSIATVAIPLDKIPDGIKFIERDYKSGEGYKYRLSKENIEGTVVDGSEFLPAKAED